MTYVLLTSLSTTPFSIDILALTGNVTATTTTTTIATTVAAAVMAAVAAAVVIAVAAVVVIAVVVAVAVAATTAMPKATMGWLRRMDRIATLTTTCVTDRKSVV